MFVAFDTYDEIWSDDLRDDRVFFDRWIFWFRQQRAPGNKLVSYEEGIKKISTISSVSFQ